MKQRYLLSSQTIAQEAALWPAKPIRKAVTDRLQLLLNREAVVQKVHDEAKKVISMSEIKTRLDVVGLVAQADFASFYMAEYQRFGDLIRKNNIKLD